MTSQNIGKFIPKHEEKIPVQARVRKSLRDEMEALLADLDVSWVAFMEASMEAFIAENKGHRKKSGAV